MNKKYIEKFTSIADPNIPAHLLSIFSIAVGMKGKKILELGVRDGYTTLPLLYAASLFDGQLTSVDINDTPWKCPEELSDNWTFCKSDAIKFLESQQNTIYDIILVDDWHSYGHVKKELELLESMVDKHSVILLHDLMPLTAPNYWEALDTTGEWANGGPFKAVHELDKKKWEWMTLPMDHGLTLLRKHDGGVIRSTWNQNRNS